MFCSHLRQTITYTLYSDRDVHSDVIASSYAFENPQVVNLQ